MDLVERIDQWSRETPNRIAHISGKQTLTFAELTRCSNVLAGSLSKQLPDNHSPIAIQGHKEPEMLISFLGAVKSGHPYIPLDSFASIATRENDFGNCKSLHAPHTR